MYEDEAGSAALASVGMPTITLTFLFTDVEGSTPLWERHEATMRQVAARHDTQLDAVITQYRGRGVKQSGGGDSGFATFADPADAVVAALDIDRVMLCSAGPVTPRAVRPAGAGRDVFSARPLYGAVRPGMGQQAHWPCVRRLLP
jgi:class 3 adenylate cyclase